MNREEVTAIGFEIVAYSGDARTKLLEAVKCAKAGDFEGSRALLAGMSSNLAAYQAGEHAASVLTLGAQYFVVCLGGTGATLVVCLMFAFLAKSKELQAVGRASSIPVLFNVNEPFLFGAPWCSTPCSLCPSRSPRSSMCGCSRSSSTCSA